MEHALVTGGEAYLRTPDADLPLLVRHSVDVWTACLGAAAVLVYGAFLLARLALTTIDAALARSVTLANAQSVGSASASAGRPKQSGTALGEHKVKASDAVVADAVASSNAVQASVKKGSVK